MKKIIIFHYKDSFTLFFLLFNLKAANYKNIEEFLFKKILIVVSILRNISKLLGHDRKDEEKYVHHDVERRSHYSRSKDDEEMAAIVCPHPTTNFY